MSNIELHQDVINIGMLVLAICGRLISWVIQKEFGQLESGEIVIGVILTWIAQDQRTESILKMVKRLQFFIFFNYHL